MDADTRRPQGVQALFASSEVLTRRIIFNPAARADAHSAAPRNLVPLNPLVLPKTPVQVKGNGRSNGNILLRTPASSEGDLVLAWQGVRKVGAGLSNLGNTCFLNSVLQSLTYTPPLAAYLESGQHRASCRVSGFCALCALEAHVKQALKTSGGVIQPSVLVRNLRSFSKAFRVGRQEDAHEFMRYLVEALHKSCMPPGAAKLPPEKQSSFIYRAFAGRLRSQVKCAVCSFTSDTYDPFLDLSLEINRADSLEKALKRFTAVEVLDGDNKYKCSKCRKKVRAHKQFTVARASAVLTIQFKRFDGGFGGKIDKKVDFPTTLDLGPFLSPEAPRGIVPTTYSLYSVLVHAGRSTHSGHYYSFIKAPTGVWHVMDDSRVRQVSEKTVLDQRAYMLFYVRNAAPKAPQLPKPVPNVTTSVKASATEKVAVPAEVKEATTKKEASPLESAAPKKTGPTAKQAAEDLKHNTEKSASQKEGTTGKNSRAEEASGREQVTEKSAAQEDLGVRIERTKEDDERRASGIGASSSMAEDEDYWDRYYSQHWVSVPPQYYYLLRFIPSARRYYTAKEVSVQKRAEWGRTLYELALEKKLERDERESESEEMEERKSKRLRETDKAGRNGIEEGSGQEVLPTDGPKAKRRKGVEDEGLQERGLAKGEKGQAKREASGAGVTGQVQRREERSAEAAGAGGREVAVKGSAASSLKHTDASVTDTVRAQNGCAGGVAQKRDLIASMLAELEQGAASKEFVRSASGDGRALNPSNAERVAQEREKEGRREKGPMENGALHVKKDRKQQLKRNVTMDSDSDSGDNAGSEETQTESERASERHSGSEPESSSDEEEVVRPGMQNGSNGENERESKGGGMAPANGVIREPFRPGKALGQYGFEVPAWDDVALPSPSVFGAPQANGPKRRYDDWDQYYDQGKQKKVKSKGLADGDYASFLASQGQKAVPDVDALSAANPFQNYASLKTKKVGGRRAATRKGGKESAS